VRARSACSSGLSLAPLASAAPGALVESRIAAELSRLRRRLLAGEAGEAQAAEHGRLRRGRVLVLQLRELLGETEEQLPLELLLLAGQTAVRERQWPNSHGGGRWFETSSARSEGPESRGYPGLRPFAIPAPQARTRPGNGYSGASRTCTTGNTWHDGQQLPEASATGVMRTVAEA